jgi:type III pantothenate kinase
MTFLAIDVGNTRLKWALYDAHRPALHCWRTAPSSWTTSTAWPKARWAQLPAPTRMLGCVVAGDAVKRRVQEQMELWDVPPQWVVSSAQEAGLTNGYDHPSRLGSTAGWP